MVIILSEETNVWYPLIAGLLTGLAALFRYDTGFYIFIANIIAALTINYITKSKRESINYFNYKKLSAYILASGVPVAITLIWYWSSGTLNSFIHDIILFPSQYYIRTRGLPFPSLISWAAGAVYTPVLVVGIVLLVFFKKEIRFVGDSKQTKSHVFIHGNSAIFLIVFTVLTVIFYLKGAVRVSPEHMQLTLIPALMILAVLIELAITDIRWLKAPIAMIATLAFISAMHYGYKIRYTYSLVIQDFTGFYNKLITGVDISTINYTGQNELPLDLTSRPPFFVDPDREAAVRFIINHTNPEDRVFIGATRHDKVYINDVSSYFQAQRLPATKWYHFDPGLQTSADIQSEMIHEFEVNKLRYLWLESTWDDINEPNESANSSGVTILDDYIRQKYKPEVTFGQISIWRRQ